MNFNDLIQTLYDSGGADGFITQIKNEWSKRATSLLDYKNKVLSVLDNPETIVEDDQLFVMSDGRGVKLSDVITAITQNDNDDPTVHTSERDITLTLLLDELRAQCVRSDAQSAMFEGIKSAANYQDLLSYISSKVPEDEVAKEFIGEALATFSYNARENGSLKDGLILWIKQTLSQANEPSGSELFLYPGDYTGKSAAAMWFASIDVDLTSVWSAIITATKTVLSGLVNAIDSIASKARKVLQSFVTAGSATAYVSINDKATMDYADVPALQISDISDSHIISLMTQLFWRKDYNETTSYIDSYGETYPEALADWFNTTHADVLASIRNTHSIGSGFELRTPVSLLQLIRQTSTTWLLRMFLKPSNLLSIPIEGGGYDWVPQKQNNSLIDESTGERSMSSPYYRWSSYLSGCNSSFADIAVTGSESWTDMYTAYKVHEGLRSSWVRHNVFLGSILMQFNGSTKWIDSTAGASNLYDDASHQRYNAYAMYRAIFGVYDSSTGGSIQGLWPTSMSSSQIVNPTNMDIIDMLTVGGLDGVPTSYSLLSSSLRMQISYLIQKLLFLYASVDPAISTASQLDKFIPLDADKITFGEFKYVIYTDQQLTKRFGRYMGGLATVAIVAAALVLTVVVTKRLRNAYIVASQTASTVGFNLGQAAADGQDITTLLQQYKRANRKSKFLSVLLSGASSAASSSANFAVSTAVPQGISANQTDLSGIITLIRGSN